MNLEDVLAAKGRRRVVTVSSKSSVADAIRASTPKRWAR